MIFQLENGGDVDVIDHTNAILNQYEDVHIYIGTDSQNKKRGCLYATVIAYRFTYGDGTRRGARYIYKKEWIDKTKDKFTRLWGEVTRSVEMAEWLKEKGFEIYQIDLDFNQVSNTGSHDMVSVGTGYCKGFGYQVSTKPDLQCATKCADHIVKKKRNRRNRKKQISVAQ